MSRRAWRTPRGVGRLAVAAAALAVAACSQQSVRVEAGDAVAGRELFVGYGCGACHQHGAVRGAHGTVGPPLDDLAGQRIVGGVLPNTPEQLAAWIEDPDAYAPDTGMPDVGVTHEDALDLAAFLLEEG